MQIPHSHTTHSYLDSLCTRKRSAPHCCSHRHGLHTGCAAAGGASRAFSGVKLARFSLSLTSSRHFWIGTDESALEVRALHVWQAGELERSDCWIKSCTRALVSRSRLVRGRSAESRVMHASYPSL